LTQSLLRWPEPELVLRQVRVGVFGSYGRGDAGVGSDLDLLLIDSDAVGPQRQRLLASGSAMAIALAQDSRWVWGRRGTGDLPGLRLELAKLWAV
jgi:hypothetical protein